MDKTAPITGSSNEFDRAGVRAQPQLSVAHHRDGGFIGQRYVLRDGETRLLGRAESCFAPGTLDDPSVSRRHLQLERRDRHTWAVDLGSRNGSFINGSAVSRQALVHGDVLTVGRVLLIYHEGPVLARHEPHPSLIGVGGAIAELLSQIRMVAPRATTVLIQGDTGVGKELVARELHQQSGRTGAFVPLNCGGVADGVIHSELFGHARGAYSGAQAGRAGLVQAAQGGTLFLDEIGDASPDLQASLLRLLEQREFRPVGSDQVVQADVRFLAASHIQLRSAVEEGRFRRDLFGRLYHWVIAVPSLRQRPEDIVPLAMHFGWQICGRPVALTRRFAYGLLRHQWSENVRELRVVVEQAAIEAAGAEVLDLTNTIAQRLSIDLLPPAPLHDEATVSQHASKFEQTVVPVVGQGAGQPSTPHQQPRVDLAATPPGGVLPAPTTPVVEIKPASAPRPSGQQLRERFLAHGGNMKALANELGIARNTLYRWFREAELDLQLLRNEIAGGHSSTGGEVPSS